MQKEKVLIIADDDMGHCLLMTRNFRRAGITNEIMTFTDGQELLDFLFSRTSGRSLDPEVPYLLLLDIRMPRVDGIETLRKLKNHPDLKKMPVIIISTTDDSRQVDECYKLGCNFYVTKPTDHAQFTEALDKLGKFIALVAVKVPEIEITAPLERPKAVQEKMQ